MLASLLSSTLKSLLWSEPVTIFNAHNSMQNQNQTQIFYKSGQTRLTWTKRDLENPTKFQPKLKTQGYLIDLI